jgi:N-methylhydantoinase A
VWFSEARAVKTSIYDREALKPGDALTGPAVIEQFDSTSILYPGDALLVDEPGNLLVSVHP